MSKYQIEKIASPFVSKGDRCAATLWLPKGVENPPIIVMAHGFGGIADAGLQPFAQRFGENGYAVLVFDYRGFGHSGGAPRHWVSARRHLEDWAAAIAHARSLPQVDADRLVLWGVSLAGGHVLQTAAKDHRISAVIAQVPHVAGPASLLRVPLWTQARLAVAGVADLIGGAFGRPHYAAIVGHPGEAAALSSADAWEGYHALLPENAPWENKVRARIFLELAFYNPILHVRRIAAPTLVIGGANDTIVPAGAARAAARRIPNARFEMLESNHFQPHYGEVFEKNIALQLGFLSEVIPGAVVQLRTGT